MKRCIHKILFIFRFAFKNVIFHPMRSILLWLGFLGVSLTIFLSISMNDVMFNYYYGKVESKYQNIDMVLEVSSQGSSRFFSISDFDDPDISNQMDAYYPFFEFDVLSSVDFDMSYVHIYASDMASFKHIASEIHTDLETLGDNQIIITKSYADTYDLNIDDQILLHASDTNKSFTIIDIIDDAYLFSGPSVFVEKQTAMSFFLESLSPTLASFPPALLTNLYNRVYIDLNNQTSYLQAKDIFENVSSYELLNYVETYNMMQINIDVNRMVALFDVVIVIVFAAIILVLETTLVVYFYDKKKMSSTISVLGGRKNFSISVLLVEICVLLLSSIYIGIILTNLIIKAGFTYLESFRTYQLTTTQGVTASLFIITIFAGVIAFHLFKFNQETDIKHMHTQGLEKRLHIKKHIIISVILMIIYVVLSTHIGFVILSYYRSILLVVCALIFLFLITPVLIHKISYVFKQSIPQALLYKKLLNKRQFYHYISMMLTVFVVIFLLMFTLNHMQKRIDRLDNEYQFDLVMTRMMNQNEDMYQEVLTLDQVDDAKLVGYFQNVETNIDQVSINQVISISGQDISDYFNVSIDQEVISQYQSGFHQIILSKKYEEVYQYQIGDSISLTFGPSYEGVIFTIAGFYPKETLDLAFINLFEDSSYESIDQNAILLKAIDKTLLEEQLINLYGQKMVIITDYNETVVDPMIIQMSRVKIYLSAIIGLMMLSFIVSLFNHTTMLHYLESEDDAKIYTLGLSKNEMIKYRIINQGVVFLISITISIIVFILIYLALSEFIVVFKTYEYILFSFTPIIYGFMLNLLIWACVMIYQIFLIKKTAYMSYIRTF